MLARASSSTCACDQLASMPLAPLLWRKEPWRAVGPPAPVAHLAVTNQPHAHKTSLCPTRWPYHLCHTTTVTCSATTCKQCPCAVSNTPAPTCSLPPGHAGGQRRGLPRPAHGPQDAHRAGGHLAFACVVPTASRYLPIILRGVPLSIMTPRTPPLDCVFQDQRLVLL